MNPQTLDRAFAPALGCLLSLFLLTSAVAQSTWTGATDGLWSTSSNWTPAGTPSSGTILQFSGSTNPTTTNDLIGFVVGGIQFTNHFNPLTTGFVLNGNQITLGGDITTSALTSSAFNPTITDEINLYLLLNGSRVITTNSASDETHNLTINGIIGETGGSFGLTKAGGARLTLNAANTYTGATSLTNGVLVLGHANSLPGGTASTGGTSALTFAGTSSSGAILGLGAGDFTRSLGTGADQVQWTGHGGFAAFDADRIVNLGGAGATVQWNAGSFVPSGNSLVFGYGNGNDAQDSSHMVTFQNPIDLNGGTRSVNVNDGNNGGALGSARIDAVLSGGLLNSSGTGAFTKDGERRSQPDRCQQLHGSDTRQFRRADPGSRQRAPWRRGYLRRHQQPPLECRRRRPHVR